MGGRVELSAMTVVCDGGWTVRGSVWAMKVVYILPRSCQHKTDQTAGFLNRVLTVGTNSINNSIGFTRLCLTSTTKSYEFKDLTTKLNGT